MRIVKVGVTMNHDAPWLGCWECGECGQIVRMESGDTLNAMSRPMFDGLDGDWPEYKPAVPDRRWFFGWWGRDGREECVTPVVCRGCGCRTTYHRPLRCSSAVAPDAPGGGEEPKG